METLLFSLPSQVKLMYIFFNNFINFMTITLYILFAQIHSFTLSFLWCEDFLIKFRFFFVSWPDYKIFAICFGIRLYLYLKTFNGRFCLPKKNLLKYFITRDNHLYARLICGYNFTRQRFKLNCCV